MFHTKQSAMSVDVYAKFNNEEIPLSQIMSVPKIVLFNAHCPTVTSLSTNTLN
jgi:hypothetical protein